MKLMKRVCAHPLAPYVEAAIAMTLFSLVSMSIDETGHTTGYYTPYVVVVVCTRALLALHRVGVLYKTNKLMSLYQYEAWNELLYASVDNAEVLDDLSSPLTSPFIFRNRQILFLRRHLQVRSGRNRQRGRYHCFCT